MPDAMLDQGHSEQDKRTIREFLDAKQLGQDFCQPYFEKGVRYYRLFSGQLPPELDGCFSKVELQIARAMIESELPRSTRAFTNTKWFDLQALEPQFEYPASAARKWLNYQMETVQNIAVTAVPTFQSVHIFGTGYRVYSHKTRKSRKVGFEPMGEVMGMPVGLQETFQETERTIISGQYTNFFNVLPLPGGSLVNPVDDTGQSAVDACLWYDYPTETEIRAYVDKGIFRGDEAERMFAQAGSSQNHPSEQYLQSVATTSGGWNKNSLPDWVRQIRNRNKDLMKRYLVGWYFKRDRWVCVAEDNFILYDGPPAIDAIPIAKFVGSYDLDNWFGTGLLEISEDLIISIMMNFNHRMDYLAGVMHPARYIPEDLLDFHNGDKSVFDPGPYQVIPYPRTINNISQAVFHDLYPNITQQTFIEEERMNVFLEKITGQTDLLKGLASGGGAESSATGVVNLVNEGTARSMMRAMNTENSGLRDSLWLTLKYASQYKNEEEWVRGVTGDGGFPWEQVDVSAITDGYGINISGTRSLQMAEETFRKMLAVAQFVVNNPVVRNQPAVIKQLMEKSGGFDGIEDLLGQQTNAPQPMPMQQGMQPGGAPTTMNDMQSMMGKQSVNNQGTPIQAGAALV